MTLEELRPFIQTLPRPVHNRLGIFTHWTACVVKPHARQAWGGKAHVEFDSFFEELRIIGNGCNAPFGCTFEDLMADDWEIVT